MKLVFSYLRDHGKSALAVPLLGGLGALILALYGLPPKALGYAALVCAVVGLALFVLPDFASYVRRAQSLERLKEELPSVLELPPEEELAGALPERLWAENARALCRELRRERSLASARRRDMLEYYTLWVHQVKTPLSALELILQSAPGEDLAPQVRDALRQELFKVERYVEMVLGYLRLEDMTADLRLESRDVHAIVAQAAKKLAPLFIYRGLSLDLKEFHNRVVTDEKWLQFVLEQLLSNAAKYTKTGGASVWMDENDVLYLRDTGVGIAPEDLPRVFERGFTGCNGRLDKSASGLGLYLSKQVLDKLQNRIEIESTPGKGTEVRLYLHRGEWKAY